MTLGERLKETREHRGLSLTQAAEELGVARTAYRLWELGAANPSPETWKDIALWCQLPIVSLMKELGHLDDESEEQLLRLSVRKLGTRMYGLDDDPPLEEAAE
jgi:transcriptional regulator with XRE-family HTH domain